MPLTKRVEILFEPKDYSVIQRVARERGETVGELIRQAVKRDYVQPDLEKRRGAARRLLAMQSDLGTWEEVKAEMERATVQRFEAP